MRALRCPAALHCTRPRPLISHSPHRPNAAHTCCCEPAFSASTHPKFIPPPPRLLHCRPVFAAALFSSYPAYDKRNLSRPAARSYKPLLSPSSLLCTARSVNVSVLLLSQFSLSRFAPSVTGLPAQVLGADCNCQDQLFPVACCQEDILTAVVYRTPRHYGLSAGDPDSSICCN